MEIKKYLPQKILYRIKYGETQQSIAQKFNTTIFNIKGDSFEEGDFVTILNASENVYAVKPMETLQDIAQKLNTTEENLIDLNHLKSKSLFVGQRLHF